VSKRFVTSSRWAIPGIVVSGLFALATLILQRDRLPDFSQVHASTVQDSSHLTVPTELGARRFLTYEQWLAVLKQEAEVAADDRPKRLTILAGDSLSLWFPPDLLPTDMTWLNQGISGETSFGLLRRLKLFDRTEPDTIFVMIGINDLIHEVREETLLANYQEIIQHLKRVHPQTRIVVQSILPHGGSHIRERYGTTTFRDRPFPRWVDRFATLPNRYIRELNQSIAQIAKEQHVEYLDLHSQFTDASGDLLTELSTDGLHLSAQGYMVWLSQLQKWSQTTTQAKVPSRSP
jgi:lysophospholipase L1-like esterase